MTVTGIVQDATGTPLWCAIQFTSGSTPMVVAGGTVVTNTTTKRIYTSSTDGTFSIVLLAGTYQVVYYTSPRTTSFNITVPPGAGPMTIDQLTTNAPALPAGGFIECAQNGVTYQMQVLLLGGEPAITLVPSTSGVAQTQIVNAVTGTDTYTLGVVIVDGEPTLSLTKN